MSTSKGIPMIKWQTQQYAMFATDISPRAHTVLSRLIDHHNQITGQCNPTEETLAAAVNCTTRTIRNALRELEDLNLIKIRKGAESPPRNHYKIQFFVGSNEDYRRAEKICLQRRKKASGKSENEPKKYRQAQEKKKTRTRLALGCSAQTGQTPAQKKGAFENILAEKLGGGEIGHLKLFDLNEALIEEALAKADHSTGNLHAAADRLLRQIEDAAGTSNDGA